MAESWIDTLIMVAITVGGLFILYKPLKEPIDDFFGLIKKGILYIKDMIVGRDSSSSYEEIVYG